MRWLLLDEVVAIRRGQEAISRSHVPEAEVSAEVLMIEMMAQTAGLLVGAESDYQDDWIFAKIEEANFDSGFIAGDFLEIKAFSENLKSEGCWINTEIRSKTGKEAGARLFLVNAGHLLQGQTEPVSFHKAFMDHFKVREKIQ